MAHIDKPFGCYPPTRVDGPRRKRTVAETLNLTCAKDMLTIARRLTPAVRERLRQALAEADKR